MKTIHDQFFGQYFKNFFGLSWIEIPHLFIWIGVEKDYMNWGSISGQTRGDCFCFDHTSLGSTKRVLVVGVFINS